MFFSDYNFKAGEGDNKGLSLQDFAYGLPDLVRPFLRLSPIISGIPKIREVHSVFLILALNITNRPVLITDN
ncbi:MAG: hypothetical protein DRR16_10225 [Candidatus Parabeggiatoa sp. nov. 3]|nr:MAG: hypothetical protein DRR00_19735 [Gammaproteobacteria bacterium]RKZ66459.1 MAG: hypothetical protein DRQ99_09650 [Gammaproteobacteria bacterium]RKZ86226.1 MAG: hypothetical protein DRR16_10225 [Gammaproteobacteria bacterium]